MECGAHFWLAINGYGPSVAFYDSMDHGQSQPGSLPLLLGGEVGIKNTFLHFRSHTVAVITYG